MAQIPVPHHIYLDGAHINGTFCPKQQMVFIIAYPYIHFFPACKNAAFYQQWLEFDCVKLAVLCFNNFLSFIAQV